MVTPRRGCQRPAPDFPPAAGARKIARMSTMQIILLVLLIALIAFWFVMRKRGSN